MPPTIVEVRDFLSCDYSKLFPVGSIFGFFAKPEIPIVSVISYLLFSKVFFNNLRLLLRIDPKGLVISRLTALHNGLLALYSGWTFVCTAPLVVSYMLKYGFWGTLCDPKQNLWLNYNFQFWLTHFYISKYYEFIDTWIVLVKGRTPIFLQTFHHAGITILMWGFVVTDNTIGLVIVCFNSFIHTLMYSYYFFATFGYQSPLKHYLTQAQIIQFLLGMSLTIPAHFISGCLTPAQSLVLGITQVYTVILIALFISFYINSYVTARRKKREKYVNGTHNSGGNGSGNKLD